jgi:hypothetical protein
MMGIGHEIWDDSRRKGTQHTGLRPVNLFTEITGFGAP